MIDETEVPKVIASGELSRLAGAVSAVGANVADAVSGVYGAWGDLPGAFNVDGANGAWLMMDQPSADSVAFRDSLNAASTALTATLDAFMSNEQRRPELITEVNELNERLRSAQAVVGVAEDEWDSHRRTSAVAIDPEDDAVNAALRAARADLADVKDEIASLRAEIDDFRVKVEADESVIAAALSAIFGGDVVRGDLGAPVSISQPWGIPAGPYAPRRSLTDTFDVSMQGDVVEQVLELATMDESSVKQWIDENPWFVVEIVKLPVAQSTFLWEELERMTGRTETTFIDEDAPVISDRRPIDILFAGAPMIIGNLNGAPAAVRDAHNQRYLLELFADPDTASDVLLQAVALGAQLDGDSLSADPVDISLLNLYLDADGELRAAVAVGDVETADTVLTMTHGIANDVGDAPTWVDIAKHTYRDARDELQRRGAPADDAGQQIATIAYLGWDSGGMTTVLARTKATEGAERLTPFVEGLKHNNPDAEYVGWFHSYGTTMAGLAQTATPGLFDRMTFFGSAGIDAATRDSLSAQVEDGTLTISGTKAWGDWTAWAGRSVGSSHGINPTAADGVSGIDVFSSRFGKVDFGPGSPENGPASRVEWAVGVSGHPVSKPEGTGYLDRGSRAYFEALLRLVDE